MRSLFRGCANRSETMFRRCIDNVFFAVDSFIRSTVKRTKPLVNILADVDSFQLSAVNIDNNMSYSNAKGVANLH